MAAALVCLGAASAAAWLAILAFPPRPWDLRPVAEDEPPPPAPAAWPSVAVVVPAHDEAAVLPSTLPALLSQDYPGQWQTVVVDDRSTDGTAGVARGIGGAGHLQVVVGSALPQGWVGKVWAMEQGTLAVAPTAPDYLLFTDADIVHTPGSLRRLVAESEAGALALNSRMARLRCTSRAERLLIPPFLFFFNLLYPMRLVNDPRRRIAAGAGGCVLVRRDVLEGAGGIGAIRGEVIDDVNLARRIKQAGGRIRLSLSRRDVVSVREYGTVRPIWRMVRRSAFDELRYSWLLLCGTIAGLALLFAAPPALLALGCALGAAGALSPVAAGVVSALGLLAWMLSAGVFLPTVRFFSLTPAWALSLPLGGLLYGGMTADSARLHLLGRERAWS